MRMNLELQQLLISSLEVAAGGKGGGGREREWDEWEARGRRQTGQRRVNRCLCSGVGKVQIHCWGHCPGSGQRVEELGPDSRLQTPDCRLQSLHIGR